MTTSETLSKQVPQKEKRQSIKPLSFVIKSQKQAIKIACFCDSECAALNDAF